MDGSGAQPRERRTPADLEAAEVKERKELQRFGRPARPQLASVRTVVDLLASHATPRLEVGPGAPVGRRKPHPSEPVPAAVSEIHSCDTIGHIDANQLYYFGFTPRVSVLHMDNHSAISTQYLRVRRDDGAPSVPTSNFGKPATFKPRFPDDEKGVHQRALEVQEIKGGTMLDPHGYLVGFVTDDRWRCHHCGEQDRVEPVAIPTSQYLITDGLPLLEAHTARARCSRCGTRADLHLVPTR